MKICLNIDNGKACREITEQKLAELSIKLYGCYSERQVTEAMAFQRSLYDGETVKHGEYEWNLENE